MSRWFRFYDRALDDPKVQRLPPDVFKGWVNLLCLAARNDGKLPGLFDIAFALRITEREADSLIVSLMNAGLLDDEPDGIVPHKWNALQFVSDRDATGAERQKRHRQKRNDGVTRYASVTSRPPEQIQRQNRTEQKDAQARPSNLIFPSDGSVEFGPFAEIIRKNAPGRDVDLVASQFRKWCHSKAIEFNSPHIAKTLATFCSRQRQAA